MDTTEIVKKDSTSSEEPGLDQLDPKIKQEISNINGEEEIDWDNIQLNKRQYKEYIQSLSDENDEDSESTIEILSSKMTSKDTIEITFKNSETSEMSELTNQFFAIIIDTFSRQLYLHSDFSNGRSQPTIIIKDHIGTVISETNDFLELGENE